ncbi:MAG: helix-turn-helix domain-containing protein [Lysobacter sp.]
MQVWVIVYAIAAAQAVLLALALWRRPANAAANHVLSAWTGLVGVDLAVKAAHLAAPDDRWLLAYAVVGLFPFLHASLFYVYVRALTTGRGFGVRDLVHLAGFAVASAAVWPQLAGGGTWKAPGTWFVLFLFGYALAYVAAALMRIARFRRELRARRADVDRQSLQWLGAMAVSQALIWCIAALHEIANIPFVDFYLIYGAVALWVFVTGWFSLAQPPVPAQSHVMTEHPPVARSGADASGEADDDARFPEVEARLAQLMAGEHLYREPALTIGQLARRSGYPEYLASAVINRRLGGTFWDYVNRLRIDAVREHLADPGDTRTILDIAYACGFTSKSTFNAAFKRQLGETPSGYRRRHAHAATASAG